MALEQIRAYLMLNQKRRTPSNHSHWQEPRDLPGVLPKNSFDGITSLIQMVGIGKSFVKERLSSYRFIGDRNLVFSDTLQPTLRSLLQVVSKQGQVMRPPIHDHRDVRLTSTVTRLPAKSH